MASQQETVDFILEQIGDAGSVSARKMFGEYGVYCDGKMVALVCDDQLFLKPTPAGRAYAGELADGVPYPGSKPCLVVPGDRGDDKDWMSELVRITAVALPRPAAKKGRRASRSD